MNEAASSILNALLISNFLLMGDRPEPDPKSSLVPDRDRHSWPKLEPI
ncbi:MAG: hypothetical protein AAF773_05965 [Cyanobacteria bacterium P01_D01_bin.115]